LPEYTTEVERFMDVSGEFIDGSRRLLSGSSGIDG